MGYPTLILLSICISNGYRKTTYTGTYTETHTEPTLKPSLKNTVLGSGRQTLVSQKQGDDDMNETNYMYGLMTISRIPTTKIQQKPSISKFSRISATNPPTKCYTHEKIRHEHRALCG